MTGSTTPTPATCSVCETKVEGKPHLECTSCSSSGSARLVCLPCADKRKSCLSHQLHWGQDHIFRRRLGVRGRYSCNRCRENLSGKTSFSCLLCPYEGGFDLCEPCYRDDSKPSHEHKMTRVSPEDIITETQVVHLKTVDPAFARYRCDECRELIEGLVFHCSTCGGSGYDVCAKCAETTRATYLHDRWVGIAPHDFVIIDMRPKKSSEERK